MYNCVDHEFVASGLVIAGGATFVYYDVVAVIFKTMKRALSQNINVS